VAAAEAEKQVNAEFTEETELVVEAARIEFKLLAQNEVHVARELEGGIFPLDAQFGLDVAQDVPEVNVEEVALNVGHHVVVVPVCDPENLTQHAPHTRGLDEVLIDLTPLQVRRSFDQLHVKVVVVHQLT